MAISLGAAALAFAGGAAKQVNQDADARSASRTRMAENMKKMKLAQKLRVQESDYVNRMKRWEDDRKHAGNMKDMTPEEQNFYIRTEIRNESADVLATRIANGETLPNVEWSGVEKKPTMKFDNDEHVEKFSDSIDVIRKMFGKDGEEKNEEELSDVVDEDGTVSSRIYGGGEGNISTFFKKPKGEKKSDIQVASERLAELRKVKEPSKTQLQEIAAHEGVLKEAELKGEPKDPAAVEGKNLFQPKDGGVPVPLVRRGLEWFLGNDQVDINDFTPIVEATAAAKAERELRGAEEVKAGIAVIANMTNALKQMEQSQTEGTAGLTGSAVSIINSVHRQITGIGEFFGIPPTTVEDVRNQISAAGIDVDKFISEDIEALRGFNKQQIETMIYTLANVNKIENQKKTVSNEDLKRAEIMVRNLTSDAEGLGAHEALMFSISTSAAGKFQRLYDNPSVNPQTRAKAGLELLKVVYPEAKLSQFLSDPKTGEVFMKIAKDLDPISIDTIIANEGTFGSLRPKPRVRVTR